MKKVLEIVKKALGWSIMVLLFLGGVSVVVYILAIIIGGEVGAGIVSFMFNMFFVWITYIVCAVVIIGLIRVYITNEHDFVLKKKKKDREEQFVEPVSDSSDETKGE